MCVCVCKAGELEGSEGEPAINVYTAGGGFGAHKDHMALTFILPLTCPSQARGQLGGGAGWVALQKGREGGL